MNVQIDNEASEAFTVPAQIPDNTQRFRDHSPSRDNNGKRTHHVQTQSSYHDIGSLVRDDANTVHKRRRADVDVDSAYSPYDPYGYVSPQSTGSSDAYRVRSLPSTGYDGVALEAPLPTPNNRRGRPEVLRRTPTAQGSYEDEGDRVAAEDYNLEQLIRSQREQNRVASARFYDSDGSEDDEDEDEDENDNHGHSTVAANAEEILAEDLEAEILQSRLEDMQAAEREAHDSQEEPNTPTDTVHQFITPDAMAQLRRKAKIALLHSEGYAHITCNRSGDKDQIDKSYKKWYDNRDTSERVKVTADTLAESVNKGGKKKKKKNEEEDIPWTPEHWIRLARLICDQSTFGEVAQFYENMHKRNLIDGGIVKTGNLWSADGIYIRLFNDQEHYYTLYDFDEFSAENQARFASYSVDGVNCCYQTPTKLAAKASKLRTEYRQAYTNWSRSGQNDPHNFGRFTKHDHVLLVWLLSGGMDGGNPFLDAASSTVKDTESRAQKTRRLKRESEAAIQNDTASILQGIKEMNQPKATPEINEVAEREKRKEIMAHSERQHQMTLENTRQCALIANYNHTLSALMSQMDATSDTLIKDKIRERVLKMLDQPME